ncbi:MAG TPA: hypothetical protein VHD15_18645 [Hyphomicrobiales bacterium]|nr:hypothetical protein [Hyphomicrobiales bacterium]
MTHNPIFEKFVGNESPDANHIEGLIAYGLYKVAKREWAQAIAEREHRPPTAEELQAYIATWTLSQLEGKRKEASDLLARFSRVVIEAAKPEIREDALRGRFWTTVWQAIFANALYTVFLIAIAFILSIAGIDILGIFTRLRGG